MPNPLFTIGHSGHPIGDFIALLRRHDVDTLADVRSIPASARHPQFRKAALEAALADAGIRYVFLGRELGARRDEPGAYEGDTVSYDRIARLPAFQQGLDWIRDNINEHRVALMCAEKDPLHCHRTLLVCRQLRDDYAGRIRHILADGSLETQADLERRLLARAGVDAAQEDLFREQEGETALDRAYRHHGR
jgi:uncharacterized protein (DUF488 family)